MEFVNYHCESCCWKHCWKLSDRLNAKAAGLRSCPTHEALPTSSFRSEEQRAPKASCIWRV